MEYKYRKIILNYNSLNKGKTMPFYGSYRVIPFQECPRCKEYEQDHVSKNCGFSLEHVNNKVIQTFRCSRCKHAWENVWDQYMEKENNVTKELAKCNI